MNRAEVPDRTLAPRLPKHVYFKEFIFYRATLPDSLFLLLFLSFPFMPQISSFSQYLFLLSSNGAPIALTLIRYRISRGYCQKGGALSFFCS